MTISTLAKPCEIANMSTKKNADNNMGIAKSMDGIDQRWIGLRHVFLQYEIAIKVWLGVWRILARHHHHLAHVGFSFRGRRALRGGPRGRRGLHAFAFGHISCNCVLNVDPYVWRVCPMWPQYRWRRRTLRALRTKRSHLDTAVSVRASRNRRASHSSSRYT